jgi:hypothetical protein
MHHVSDNAFSLGHSSNGLKGFYCLEKNKEDPSKKKAAKAGEMTTLFKLLDR